MSKNKYQVWEGEMEVQHLDTSDAALVTVVFSAMLGIILFVVLLCKTGLETMLKTTRTEKEKRHRSID
jgi:hypothetical protein